ncbi:hypothetical protein Ancab_038398 [Ancistrocladus abbreviatus]
MESSSLPMMNGTGISFMSGCLPILWGVFEVFILQAMSWDMNKWFKALPPMSGRVLGGVGLNQIWMAQLSYKKGPRLEVSYRMIKGNGSRVLHYLLGFAQFLQLSFEEFLQGSIWPENLRVGRLCWM